MDVVIPTVGTIAQCAGDSNYQLAIQTEGMVKDIVKHLSAAVSINACFYAKLSNFIATNLALHY